MALTGTKLRLFSCSLLAAWYTTNFFFGLNIFPKFPISGTFRFGMVLNGKAELAARAAKAAKCRYEQLELCGIVVVLSLALLLSYQLYLNMVDGWQEIPVQRWHVLLLSLTLLLTSIVTCVYLCRRLQPIVRLPPHPGMLTSVNSQLFLITGERPPSYDSITRSDLPYVPPPPYNVVFNV